MELWQAIVLGCVQGLSEFLPISSSGHLVVFQRLMALPQHDVVFDVAVHLATAAAILTVYRKQFFNLLTGLLRPCPSQNSERSSETVFVWYLIVGTLPALVAGLLFRHEFEQLFSSLRSTGVGFLLTGALIAGSAWRVRAKVGSSPLGIDWRVALVVGFVQALAMVPGLSRSGSTIAAALLMGVGRERAAFFSFSLAVPVVLGAGVLKLGGVEQWSWPVVLVLLAGSAAAYVLGLVALRWVVALVVAARWQVFVWYLWPLGLACIAWDMMLAI